jgi:hypothetical protein
MDIKEDIYNNYFFTSHINNSVIDETKPYSLFGYDNARVFKDISTDSFVNNIFDEKKKLFDFVDYTFYSIFTKIPKIHKSLYLNNYFMNSTEYLTIIFKGGNTMSFFFDIIINTISEKNSELFDVKLNKIHEYLRSHNVDLKIIDDEMYYLKSDNTIKDFFAEQKKKFKISDVDFTMYINTNDPVKYSVISQLYNKILINSLIDIRNFFDSYYLNVKNMNYNKELNDIKFNQYLPFKSNDTPYNTYIKIFEVLIENIKSSNMQNFYKTSKSTINIYLVNIENDFIQIFFNQKFRVIEILLEGYNEKNFLNPKGKYYLEITNIRLITVISEYLELLQIYFNIHKKTNLKLTVQDLLTITRKIINHHLSNKKRLIIDSNMYNIDSINNFIIEITSKYNKETNPSLYNTKYTTSFDKKEIMQKINLIRKNPNSNLYFTKYNNEDNEDDKNNDLNILPKSDVLTYSINNINLYSNNTYDSKHHHYISYNNSTYNSYEQFSRKFDLFRIKFNIKITKPIIKIDDKIMEEYNIPSEFIDVSIPAFSDINRKYFYSEVQEEGINILRYTDGSTNYYWNTYSIHQLFDDLLQILFGSTIVPWYDAKYDKRIIRLLLLFSFYKIEKNMKKSNSGCEWICFLTDVLKLTNELYIYTSQINVDNLFSVQSIKPFVLGKNYNVEYSYDQSMTIEKYILDNIFYKLNELGYNQTIKIDEYYADFEQIIRFLIFYSYSMKKSCFHDVFNILRNISGLLPYEPNKTIIKDGNQINIIDYNNSKFKELLKLMTNTISVILFILNETNKSCNFKDLTKCVVGGLEKNCEYVKPIHCDFDSYYYKYYTDVIEKNKLINGKKKYIVKNINK